LDGTDEEDDDDDEETLPTLDRCILPAQVMIGW
jgi:hypothetical protein